MKALSLVELKKRNNLDTFLEKWKAGEKFTFLTGSEKALPKYTATFAKLLRDAVAGDAAAKKALGTEQGRKIIPLTSLAKTAEFGGSGGGKQVTGSVKYGRLSALKLTEFDTSAFLTISTPFASGKLVTTIKEASDVKAVSDFNMALDKILDDPDGMNLTVAGFRFTNIIGCIPVTNGEPKADLVLVKIDNKKHRLIPAAFISYKMGTNAKGFQNYSGLSDKSSPEIFKHKETKQFYKTLESNNKRNVTTDAYQVIKDKMIIGKSVWGMDYGSAEYHVDNVHFLAQGEVSISGGRVTYSHVHKNGDFNFSKEYQPVFGARRTTGRNNHGPDGIYVTGYRIGIFPRAYRTSWLSDT